MKTSWKDIKQQIDEILTESKGIIGLLEDIQILSNKADAFEKELREEYEDGADRWDDPYNWARWEKNKEILGE